MTDLRQALTRSIAETGAHLRIVPPERTLATVLAEIKIAGPMVWDNAKYNALTFEEKGVALVRLDDLQAEARDMIEEATGVSWRSIEEGCL